MATTKLILLTGATGYIGGRLLKELGVPVLEFRASISIGSGSLSFELIQLSNCESPR